MGPRDPRLSSPAGGERSPAKGKGTGGQYVVVCSVSNSPLTHNPFVTLLQPFRIKYERYIFLKECVRSSLLLILLPHVYVYSFICIRLYNPCRLLNIKSRLYVPIPPRPLVTSTSLNHFNLGRWSSSGSDRSIAHFFIATRNTIKGVGEKEQRRDEGLG